MNPRRQARAGTLRHLLRAVAAFGFVSLAVPCGAVPAFPPGYGQGFPVLEDIEWTGPSLEPVREYGLKLKISRLDGETTQGTVGTIRERFLRALKDAGGWVIPPEGRVDKLDRYEETFVRKVEDKLQLVDLLVFRQKDMNYIVVKAYQDRKLVGPFDPAKVPHWRLPKGYAEGFPIHPLAEIQQSVARTVNGKDLGVKDFQQGFVIGIIPGTTIPPVRDWYVGKLKELKWPVPGFFNEDSDEKFQQNFARRLDKVRMAVVLTLEQAKPEDPVKFILKAEDNQIAALDDDLAKILQDEQEKTKDANDPAKEIVDIDPNDPDIDFAETPRGWAAGFPVHPDTQYVSAKLVSKEVIGMKWREAVITGVFLQLSVADVKKWYLEAVGKAGFEVPSYHEEDDSTNFRTKFIRKTENFYQSAILKIYQREDDGLTEAVIIGQEDKDLRMEGESPDSGGLPMPQ